MRISKRLFFVLVAVLLLLGAGTVAYAVTTSFPDVPTDYWAYNSIMKMTAQGVIQGHADGNFGPDENVTRAQVAVFLDRQQTVCTQCHNSTTLITGKETEWAHSMHGSGEVYWEERDRPTCAACHDGGGFSTMIAEGKKPSDSIVVENPTPADCRACHAIHTTLTSADWALETTAPVALYALTGNTFSGGAGNLCANCHQPRSVFPAATEGMVTVGTRFGPHHGPEAALLLGVGGAGATVGAPMMHYTAVADTCVSCHMGEGADHTFDPNVAACKTCHADATDFNIGGSQTEVQAMLDELKALLITKGLLDAEGVVVAGSYPEAQAAALWNWTYITEDKSLGVHNPAYSKALLQSGIDALK